MILTVTMNPSVDISYQLAEFCIDDINRCEQYSKTAGGKGLNVTRVVHQMRHPVLATGLLGGELGAYIERQLQREKIAHRFSPIAGDTRNCIAVLHDDGKQTEILESGPVVSSVEAADFEQLYDRLLANVDVVTISGSLPKGVDDALYTRLIQQANTLGKKVVLDVSGAALTQTLQSDSKPYAIKPNRDELLAIAAYQPTGDDVSDLQAILNSELFAGIPLIVVSLGADGAFVKHGETFYKVTIPRINVVNPVGSGDATVAGLALALADGRDLADVLKIAMTLGMLNTMEQKTGHVDVAKFAEYVVQVQVAPL